MVEMKIRQNIPAKKSMHGTNNTKNFVTMIQNRILQKKQCGGHTSVCTWKMLHKKYQKRYFFEKQ